MINLNEDILDIPRTEGSLQPTAVKVIHQVDESWLGLLSEHCLSLDSFDLFDSSQTFLGSCETLDMV